MANVTGAQQRLIDAWETHTAAEFQLKDADAALSVMTDDPVLIHVPIGAGARGRDALHRFYAEIFIPQVPADASLDLLTRNVSDDHLVDEFVFAFTHTVQMDWLAPGIPATGRTVALPHVAIISFERGRIASEHIYWDQSSTLVQLGVLDPAHLPVLGGEQADPLRGRGPSNALLER
jgi:carboxymethylenebutenolidase